jgi:hypothetical protein
MNEHLPPLEITCSCCQTRPKANCDCKTFVIPQADGPDTVICLTHDTRLSDPAFVTFLEWMQWRVRHGVDIADYTFLYPGDEAYYRSRLASDKAYYGEGQRQRYLRDNRDAFDNGTLPLSEHLQYGLTMTMIAAFPEADPDHIEDVIAHVVDAVSTLQERIEALESQLGIVPPGQEVER